MIWLILSALAASEFGPLRVHHHIGKSIIDAYLQVLRGEVPSKCEGTRDASATESCGGRIVLVTGPTAQAPDESCWSDKTETMGYACVVCGVWCVRVRVRVRVCVCAWWEKECSVLGRTDEFL